MHEIQKYTVAIINVKRNKGSLGVCGKIHETNNAE
jgi:hypothetical protein